jgi:hypothetical protein
LASDAWVAIAAIVGAHTYLTWRRLLAYLRYFQQEGYEALRFLNWARFRSLTDPMFWLAALAWVLFPQLPVMAVTLFCGTAILFGALQPDPRRSGRYRCGSPGGRRGCSSPRG